MSRFQSHLNQPEPRLSSQVQALQTTFRGLDPSPALRAQAEARFLKLAKQFGHILRCHAVIERPTGDLQRTALLSVRLQLHADGYGQTVAQAEHVSAAVALREAFERMATQLAARGENLAYARRMMPEHVAD